MTDDTKQFRDEWLVPTLKDHVSGEQIENLRENADENQLLWDLVVSEGLIQDEQLLSMLSERFRLRLADVKQIDPAARDLIPEQVARRYRILPLAVTDARIDIATSNPFDLDAEKSLAFATGREVRLLLASPSIIQEKSEEFYRPEKALDKLIEGMDTGEMEITQLQDEVELDEFDLEDEAAQRPIVKLVDLILSEGIAERASDIHIEAEEDGVTVRYRIDGVLRRAMKIPRRAGIPLVSRVKIMAKLDIADRLRPQDGRAKVAVNGIPIDLRVSTLPASLGEKVVVRILDSRSTLMSLENLGMGGEESTKIQELLQNREGMILVTGPTGSGKTTTLYAALRFIHSEGVNIVTVEDPVEYRIAGIVQVQVHDKAGLTFSSALRSILRQDPDVVLLGEIRDRETAQIAIQASLTGHLVLSTLHTNDAANAVTRLIDLGLEPFKIAPAIRGVLAQRLVRRLCKICRETDESVLPPRLRRWVPEGTPLFRSLGCPECATTGYRGRIAILEILEVSPAIERAIGQGATAEQIASVALNEGTKTMWESGLTHVLSGETSLEELQRVVDVPREDEIRPQVRPQALPATEAPSRRRSSGEATVARRRRDSGASEDVDLESAFDLIEDELEETSAEPRCVLLVDDEDSLRKVMRDLLERDGYRVEEARDGSEALDQVDKINPDIIVLDLNLPGLDGYGVLEQLRSRPTTSDIPVIVLTAKGDEDNEVRVFELGADDFLAKPFRARALSARLDAVLGRRRRLS